MEAAEQFSFNFLDPPEPEVASNDFEDLTLDDAEVRTMHLELLEQSLHQFLDTRSSVDTCAEILEWMNRDSEGPFTFRTCCELAGYSWRDLRETTMDYFYCQNRERKPRGVRPPL